MANKVTVFVFVEGKETDPYFYGEICEPLLSNARIGYEIVGAWRLAEAGGKEVLIGFHDYLAVTGSLLATFQGKRFAAFFFLDKDIDDILNAKTISDHVVYTEYYTVENYLFVHGDLARAAAAASSLERREFLQTLGNGDAWRRASAQAWADWVTFCIFAHKYHVGCEYNYRRATSTINNPLDAPANANVVQQHKAMLLNRSRMSNQQFDRTFGIVSRLVGHHYRRGTHDKLFSGKWYVAIMQAHIERVAAGRPYTTAGLSNRIVGALRSTVDFSLPWTEHFRRPLRNLIAQI